MIAPRNAPYSYQVGVALGLSIFGPVGAKVTGRENIPESGPILLVSNHQSFLDPLFVSLKFPRQIHYMAKEELFSVPISKHMMLGLGAFPVNRNGPTKATLAQVLRLLREGRCVCLFAEGTRSKDGKLQEFQTGFARIAKKTKTPVLPVGLTGSRQLFEDLQGMSLPLWSRIIGYPAPQLKYGEPVSPDLSVEDIARVTHERVGALIEECRGS